MSKRQESTFLEGAILPALMKFAVPILLALFLQAMYGAVDLWVVGTFCGPAEVSAVATGSQTMLIITGIITGLSMGSTILLAQKVGEKDNEGAADTIGSSVWIFAILSITLTIGMLIAAPTLAAVMNAPQAAFDQTVHYIMICSGGTVFIAAYNLASSIFRALGNSKLPLLFVGIACVTNIIGDIVLVEVFKMGVAGTALATVLSQAVSVIFSLVVMIKNGFPFPFAKHNLAIDTKIAHRIVRLGSPIALQDMCNELSFLILIGIVNALGLTQSAGMGIAERLVMFMLLIPMAYMSSISTMVAQNVGANQLLRAKKAMWLGMSTALVFGIAMFWLSFFHGDMLSSIFSKDAAVIAASADFLKATSIECLVLSMAYCFTGYFNGLGHTTFVMAQGLCASFLVRVPIAYAVGNSANPTMFRIGLSAASAAAFTFTVCVLYYFRISRKSTAVPVLGGQRVNL